jgi:4-amino-4-deoxy-L-arabinose transferase-like glycosyltransferase
MTEGNSATSSENRSRLTSFKKIAWMILIFGVAIRVVFLFLPLTFGSDVWRQADTASIARHFLLNGFRVLFPQINWGGNGPGYVESEFQLYPFLVAVIYKIFGEHLWIGRLVSLLISIGTMRVFQKLSRQILSERAALWSFGFFVISPLFIRYSVAFTPEALMMFFYVSSIYAFEMWLEKQDIQYLVLAGLTTSLAILVKGTPAHIFLVFGMSIFYRYKWSAFGRWDLWSVLFMSLVAPVLWYLHARSLYLTFGNTFGVLSGGDSKFGSMAYWFNPVFYLKIAKLEIEWVFGGVSILAFAVGFLGESENRAKRLVAFGSITLLLYYFIVARYSGESWGIQYHIFAVPFVSLGIGRGMEWLQNRNGAREKALVYVLVVGSLLGTAFLFNRMLSQVGNFVGRMLIQCGETVQQVVPKGALIVVSTIAPADDNGTPNNYEEPTVFFYADRYGWSLPSDRHRPELLEEYRSKGAAYFVIYNRDLLEANPDLGKYLADQAVQKGPGVEQGCGIYQFNNNGK